LIKVLSFDLEGTLTTLSFSKKVWNEGIPKLYAEQNGVSFSEAYEIVLKEYWKIGDDRVEWYDIKFWFKKLNLRSDWRSLLRAYLKDLAIYPEVPKVLSYFKGRKSLIIISNSSREFLDIALKLIGDYFDEAFSAVSDFNMLKDDPKLYEIICERLNVEPGELSHVGDHYLCDYLTPRKLGIRSFFLDRSGMLRGEWVVKDLLDFRERVRRDC